MRHVKYLLLAAILLFCALSTSAQSYAPVDDFGGRMDVSCPAPGHRVNATISQSGTTKTVTITGATITLDPQTINGNQYDYDVAVTSGPTFRIALNEPIIVGATSTAMDWHYVNDQLQGGDVITAVTTGTPGSITLASDGISNTISSTAGWIEPGRYYDPFTQGTSLTALPITAAWSVNVPGRGTTYPICDPEGHYIYVVATSQFCDQNAPGQCNSANTINFSSTAGAITESGGVVSAPTTLALPSITPGSTTVNISGVSDPTYNTIPGSPVTVQTNPSPGVITYILGTAPTNATAIGGVAAFGSNQYMLISESHSGTTVTATFSVLLEAGMGSPVTLSGVADATYNCNYNITGEAGNIANLTPASGCTPSGTATQGGSMKLNGYVTWPARFTSIGQADLGMTTEAKGIGFNAIGEDSTCDVLNGSGSPAGGWPTNIDRGPALAPACGTVLSPSLYALGDKLGYASQATHSLVTAIDYKFPGVFSAPNTELDWADPNFFTYALNDSGPISIGGPSSAFQGVWESMNSIGMMPDDTDVNNYAYSGAFWWGIQNSTIGQGGAGGTDVGLIAAIADPHQVVVNYNGTGAYNPIFFPSDALLVKTLSATAPAGCWAAVTMTAPSAKPVGPSEPICGSWPDWERNWYGTTVAMNTAYGSNYTSFGSNETVVAQTSPSGFTGNGSTADFTAILHTNVTPGSLHIYLQPGGTGPIYMISGDCPYWPTSTVSKGNNCPTVTAGEGTLMDPTTTWPGTSSATTTVQVGYLYADTTNNCIWYATTTPRAALNTTWSASGCSGTQVNGSETWQALGPTLLASSTITYSTGGLTVNFSANLASGTVIYVSYTYNGYDTVNGTGLADDDGQDTGCGFACGSATVSGSAVTWTAGNSFVTGGNWTGLAINLNGTVCHIASVNSTTSITLTSSCGSSGTFNVSGYGTNEICIQTPPAWTATTNYTAYRSIVRDAANDGWFLATSTGTSGSSQPSGMVAPTSATWGYTITGDGTVSWQAIGPPYCGVSGSGAHWLSPIDAQPALATDINNWIGYGLGGAYLSSLQKMFSLLAPDAIMEGTNFGPMNYDAPSYPSILQTYEAFSDAVFLNTFPIQAADTRGIGASYDPVEPAKYKYFTSFYNKPIVEENFPIVSAGFDETCINQTNYCINSIIGRSEEYYDMVNVGLQAQSPSSIFQNAGTTWWWNMGAQSKSFGYLDKSGNLIDGHEDVAGSVACSYFTSANCGGEVGFPSVGVDAVNCAACIKPANKLWLLLPATITVPAIQQGVPLTRKLHE